MQPSKARGYLRTTLFLSLTAVMVPVYIVLFPLSRTLARKFSVIWYDAACMFCGLTVKTVGAPSVAHPTLFVSNHVSYLDIPVLASRVNACFVAKREVAGWPPFGFLAKLARTVFIDRATMQAKRQRNALAKRIASDNLILFPEGTSSDGMQVLPFKSTLFSVAKHGPAPAGIMVQPVSVAYVRDATGAPLSEDNRHDYYAWYGDMELLPHLFNVFCLPGAEVRVTFGEPVDASAFETRKDLARHCEAVVTKGLSEALSASTDTVAA